MHRSENQNAGLKLNDLETLDKYYLEYTCQMFEITCELWLLSLSSFLPH